MSQNMEKIATPPFPFLTLAEDVTSSTIKKPDSWSSGGLAVPNPPFGFFTLSVNNGIVSRSSNPVRCKCTLQVWNPCGNVNDVTL